MLNTPVPRLTIYACIHLSRAPHPLPAFHTHALRLAGTRCTVPLSLHALLVALYAAIIRAFCGAFPQAKQFTPHRYRARAYTAPATVYDNTFRRCRRHHRTTQRTLLPPCVPRLSFHAHHTRADDLMPPTPLLLSWYVQQFLRRARLHSTTPRTPLSLHAPVLKHAVLTAVGCCCTRFFRP